MFYSILSLVAFIGLFLVISKVTIIVLKLRDITALDDGPGEIVREAWLETVKSRYLDDWVRVLESTAYELKLALSIPDGEADHDAFMEHIRREFGRWHSFYGVGANFLTLTAQTGDFELSVAEELEKSVSMIPSIASWLAGDGVLTVEHEAVKEEEEDSENDD